ncbi:MAG: fibronectin type III domain-containing protein [Nocardioides sp.]
MISRAIRVLVLMVLVVGLAAAPRAVAAADEAPDTTPPQINLNPCYEGTSCRRVYAQIYGYLQEGDDLAVLGARIGDVVVAEHVYDDGTGFVPLGWFLGYGSDVVFEVDYALSVEVPRGTSDITFYARDLEGNTSELTTTVLGPVPPGPVRRLRAVLFRAHTARISWRMPDLKGSMSAEYVVRTPGRAPKAFRTGPPSFTPPSVYFRRLSPGWHRFTVRVHTVGGAGPPRTVRLFVPRSR